MSHSFFIKSVSLGIGAFLALSQLTVAAPISVCQQALIKKQSELSTSDLKGLREGFKHDPSSYTKRLESATPVRDQCQYGSCWIHSFLKTTEYSITSRTGQHVPLSSGYLLFRRLQLDAVRAVVSKKFEFISQGNSLVSAEILAMQFGLVPDAAWKPRVAFEENGSLNERVMLQLNQMVLTHHRLISRMKKRGAPEAELNEQFAQAQKDIRGFLASLSGPMPAKFTYEGKTYTPVEFGKEIAGIEAADLQIGILKATEPKSAQMAFAYIKEEIDAGRSVLLGIKVVKSFMDKESGVMSIGAFHSPFHKPQDAINAAKVALKLPNAAGGHAVAVTGYEVDAAGNPVKLLIENSWGDDFGDHGFNHLYWDYFTTFPVTIAIVRKKPASEAVAEDPALPNAAIAWTDILEN